MTFPEVTANTTDWRYTGDIPALGSLQLTMLVRSFEQIQIGNLGDIFPDQNIEERTIRIDRITEGLGIAPIVQQGKPAGSFMENGRSETRYESPVHTRMDDFLDQAYINQLRRPGTYNDRWSPEDIIADRVRRMLGYHTRLKDFLRAQVLLGGINYTDPRTDQSLNVSTFIPPHNLFRYDGFDGTLAAGATVPGTAFEAAKNLTNNKNRREAMLFTDAQNRIGVPWTNPSANLVYALRLLKHFLWTTNKNQFTEIVMGHALYQLLHENEFVKAYSGQLGIFRNFNTTSGTLPNQISAVGAGATNPTYISYGPGGDIQAIAGLRVRVLSGLFRHPETNRITNYWPSHKVALIAPRHYEDPNATLGFTHHCTGEAPDGAPGLWMRSGPDQQPPSPPGRTMQMGDAFLPFAVYPHWISVIDVCEPNDIATNLILDANESYGTF